MKTTLAICALVIALLGVRTAFGQAADAGADAQTKDKDAVEIDYFGRMTSEELEARLDNATIVLRSDPDSSLQFVFSRGEKESYGAPYRVYGLMKTYLLYRKVDMNRVVATFCKPQAKASGQIWLINAGGTLRTCDQDDIDISATTLFDNAPSATGRGNDYGCCIVDTFGPAAAAESVRAFAQLLKRYPASRAYVYAYGGTNVYWTTDSRGRNKAVRNPDTAKDIAVLSRKVRHILAQNGIPASRIITRSSGYSDAVARVEMWIVPPGGEIPKTSANYPQKKRYKRPS